MRFKKYLEEKFKTSFLTKDKEKTIEVFENPTRRELNELIKNGEYNGVRFGIIDSKKPTVYAWDGYLFHRQMYRRIKFDFGFYKDPTIINKRITLHADFPEGWKTYFDLKNQEEIRKTIKSLFPKENKIDITKIGILDLNTGDIE